MVRAYFFNTWGGSSSSAYKLFTISHCFSEIISALHVISSNFSESALSPPKSVVKNSELPHERVVLSLLLDGPKSTRRVNNETGSSHHRQLG